MEKIFYNTISENFLSNFLNIGYKYTVVSSKQFLVNKIQDNCPFKLHYESDSNVLEVNFGEVSVYYNMIWEEKIENNFKKYYLRDITINKTEIRK